MITTRLHHAGWLETLTVDLDKAAASISITALSIHYPATKTAGPLGPFWAALAAATSRGIRPALIMPAPSRSHPATAMNGNTAEKAHALGLDAHLIPLPRLLHAKSAVIDSRIAWVGSGNFTAAAACHNREIYMRSTDPAIARHLASYHEFTIHGVF